MGATIGASKNASAPPIYDRTEEMLVNLIRLPRTNVVGFVLAAAGIVACSAAPSDSDTSTDGLHIHPGGNEHESHLTLQLPTDACQPGASCAKVLGRAVAVFVDGAAVSL